MFDVASSFAYMLVGVLAPYEAGFYLSRGNKETCKFQGFLVQLGQTTSMLYNLFLSLYFFLVIVHGWREQRFAKMIPWAHAGAIGLGLAMAGGSIPFVQPQFGVCGILPPLTEEQWQISLLFTMPVSIALVVLTLVTARICWKVYSQSRKASKWLAGKGLSITRKVFWQSFCYVLAFYVTLPFLLLSFYIPYESEAGGFWVFAVAAVLAPLQGMMNAFVYFQRNKGIIDIVGWFFGSVWTPLCKCCVWLKKLLQCRKLRSKRGGKDLAENQVSNSLTSSGNSRNMHSSAGSMEQNMPEPEPNTEGNGVATSLGREESKGFGAFSSSEAFSDELDLIARQDREAHSNPALNTDVDSGHEEACYDRASHWRLVSQEDGPSEETDGKTNQQRLEGKESGYEIDIHDDDKSLTAILEHWKLNEDISSSTCETPRRQTFVPPSSLDDDAEWGDKSGEVFSRSYSGGPPIRKLFRTASRGLVSRESSSQISSSKPSSSRHNLLGAGGSSGQCSERSAITASNSEKPVL